MIFDFVLLFALSVHGHERICLCPCHSSRRIVVHFAACCTECSTCHARIKAKWGHPETDHTVHCVKPRDKQSIQ